MVQAKLIRRVGNYLTPVEQQDACSSYSWCQLTAAYDMNWLDCPPELLSYLFRLVSRHARYGVNCKLRKHSADVHRTIPVAVRIIIHHSSAYASEH